MRGAGIEPDIQNVIFLAPLGFAARALSSGGQEFLGSVLVPSVRAFLFKPTHHVAQRLVIFEAGAARLTIKNDNRHSPEALARNSPVRALFDHVVHAVFAPGGNPFNVADFVERFLAQSCGAAVCSRVHLDEPLLSGTKNYGIVAAPTMRITVLIVVMSEQRATIGQELDNNWIGGEYVLAFIFRQALQVTAAIINRRIGLESIFLTGVKVVRAVPGRGVHNAAALIERNVVSENARHLNWQKGMLELHS